MPITQTITTQITCDNPDCPGNDLDPADRTGWTFVTVEIPSADPLAQPLTSSQKVFCSSGCTASFSTVVAANERAWIEATPA